MLKQYTHLYQIRRAISVRCSCKGSKFACCLSPTCYHKHVAPSNCLGITSCGKYPPKQGLNISFGIPGLSNLTSWFPKRIVNANISECWKPLYNVVWVSNRMCGHIAASVLTATMMDNTFFYCILTTNHNMLFGVNLLWITEHKHNVISRTLKSQRLV